MKIKILSMNNFGCSTEFEVNGYYFNTSNFGDGLYHIGVEIIPPEFFSLNQSTKSGRWKAIKKLFSKYNKLIWEKVHED